VAHYAYVNSDSIVTQVIVGRDEGEDGIDWEQYYGAVRTSYNTHGNQHTNGGTPFRGNYAGVGFRYDPDFGPDGAFIPAQPHPSWVLNPDTALWDAPVPTPAEGGPWTWDEASLSWAPLAEEPSGDSDSIGNT
jgi:hypothetical protein